MLGYDLHEAVNIRRAADLLEKLKPKAIKLAKNRDAFSQEVVSGLASNMLKYASIDRVSGVHVYQGELGGWFADLVFDGMPVGVPNIVGTPTSKPLESRTDAVNAAISYLAMIIVIEGEGSAPSPEEVPHAVFPFDGLNIQLESSLIAKLMASPDKPDRQWGLNKLQSIRDRFAQGKPITGAIMDRLTTDERIDVFMAAAMAMALGILRFPENPGETPPPSKQH